MRTTIVAIFFATLTLAQSKQSENTLKLDDPRNMAKATIQDVAWISGHWQGQALGGLSDEYLAPPMGGAMMCMYRLIRDGKVVFYELVRIAEENGSLIIRLKHFHPDMKGWEEKDQTVEFPLVKISEDAAWFDGMTLQRTGPDSMTVFLVISDKKTARTREMPFVYQRIR